METFILPINLPVEATEPIQPRDMAQPGESFSEILGKFSEMGGGEMVDQDPNPNQASAENPEFSMIALLYTAFLGPNLPGLEEEKSIPVPSSPNSQFSEPSSHPSVPVQEQNLAKLFSSEGNAPLKSGEVIFSIPPQNPKEVGPNPPSLTVTPEIPEGGTGVTSMPGASPVPPNQEPLLPTKEDPLPQTPVEAFDVTEGEQKNINPSLLTPKGKEPVNHPLAGSQVNKERLPSQENLPQTWPAEVSQNIKEDRPILPRTEFIPAEKNLSSSNKAQEMVTNLNDSRADGHKISDDPIQVLPTSGKEMARSFPAMEEKGPERILWARNEPSDHAGKENQSLPGPYGPLQDLNEGLSRMVDKLDGAKNNYAPTQVKSEDPAIHQQVGQRVMWLVRNNEERIKLTLDPPELGHIYMEIDRNKENIKATLWADNPSTKLTLETSQAEIQKIIEKEGFRLDKFDVFVRQEMSWFQERKENQMNSHSWNAAPSRETQAQTSISLDPLPMISKAGYPGSRHLDLFV